MLKVSKNLKKIRNEKNLTQDVLAERIHVTRQAISNWETGKTKPDVEMLLAIADALDVQVEELIYGEKKENLEIQDKSKKKNVIKIILGIVGSIFFAVGLALIFFEFWSDFPVGIQGVFAFLPALLGQLAAVYVVLKKKGNVTWHEGAAVLWTVGVVLTVAMFNEIFSLSFGYFNCMVIDIILTAPIMFILKSVSPLAFYYYMTLHTSAEGRKEYLIFGFIFFFVGVLFNILMAKNKEDVRGKYTQWLTVIASLPFIAINVGVLDSLDIIDDLVEASCVAILAYAICMYIFSAKINTFILPYKPISILCMGVVMPIMAFGAEPLFGGEFIKRNLVFLVLMAIPIVCFFISRVDTEYSISEILLLALPTLFIGIDGLLYSMQDFSGEISFSILSVLIFAYGGALVINGIKELKLFYVNIGLLQIFAQIILVFSYFAINILVYGAILVAFGITLFVINGKLLSAKKMNKANNGGAENEK